MGKISTINELARHRVGQSVFAVMFRPVGLPEIKIPVGEEWMADAHPKVLYERGIASKAWHYRARLPRLHALDFCLLVNLLTTEPIVEDYLITEIFRSPNTGEFYYNNELDEWMPESNLWTNPAAARREKTRIKGLVARWASRESPDPLQTRS